MQSSFLSRRGASCVASGLVMAAIALLPADAAAGNDQCSKHKDITQQLQQKCKERLVGLGITSQGGLVEVLAAHDGATWSIIVTTPEGVTCLVAAGEGWRSKSMVAAGLAL